MVPRTHDTRPSRGDVSDRKGEGVRKWTRALVMLATVVLTVLALVGLQAPASAAPGLGGDPVELTLFWGDGCPHCAAEHEWLAEAKEQYPNLVVTEYEVWFDEDNRELLAETAEEMGFEPTGVPVTIIGDRHWIGFSDAVQAQMELTIAEAATGGMITEQGETSSSTVDVPLVGEVSVSSDSLVMSTLVIGFVDGVNPCSLWVISVLLAIVVRTGNRRRVFAIGTTFLLVTAVMYAVYMVGIFSAMSVMGHLGAIQLVVALVAGIFGVVSVKDYFAFKKGISFTIKDSAKPGIYRRMRAAAGQEYLLPALGATILLAVGVSLLETPCTAGFPVLWSGLLTANGVGTAEAVGLFGLYMLPFLLDELIVFTVAVVTLRATKMQERHGRLLKLVAGTTMLALAGTVLVSPATMNEPIGALTVFAAAFAVAALVHLATTALTRRREATRADQVRAAP